MIIDKRLWLLGLSRSYFVIKVNSLFYTHSLPFMDPHICSCPDTFWNSLFTIVCICLFIVIYDKIKALRSPKSVDSPEKMMQGVFGVIGDMLPKMMNNVDNTKVISSAPSLLSSTSLVSSGGASSSSSSSSRAAASGPRYSRKTTSSALPAIAAPQSKTQSAPEQSPKDDHTFSVDDVDVDEEDNTIDD